MAERTLEELAREITAGAVRLAAATAGWLRLVGEFDAREGWAGCGIKSCAHWLSWQCGLGPGAAREHVRVARALRGLPVISAAFEAGRISYAKARALTRVADPASEAGLLEFALEATASQTERTMREIRRADRVDERRVVEKRQFNASWDEDGMLRVTARLDGEQGAEFLAAVESLAERYARRDRAEAKRVAADHDLAAADREVARRYDEHEEVRLARERTAARRCEALAALARAAVAADRRPGDPPRREVVVHVDADVLADDAAAGRAYLEGGGPALAPADVRRMLCEATVLTMLEQGREVLAVGRARRRATRAQRRALLRRDGGCARPGCPENRIERLHAHHLRHWLFGGRTDLANLVLLCDADHGLVHAQDLVLSRRDGRLIVTDPDGRRVWGDADAAFPHGLAGLADSAADPATQPEVYVGVHPLDTTAARRPETPLVDRCAPTRGRGPSARRRRGRRPPTATRHARTPTGRVSTVLFPDGEPPGLPDVTSTGGERLRDLDWAVHVLMANRDVARRMAAETGAPS